MTSYSGYIYRNSLVHRMNPSLKFIMTIILIVLIFIPYGFFFQIILFGVILAIYCIAKLPFKKFIKIFQSILFMMAILLIINWIAYKDPGVVFDLESQSYMLHKPSWLNPITNPSHISLIDGKYFLQGNMFGGKPLIDLSQFGVTEIGKINLNSIQQSNGFYVWNTTSTSSLLNDINNLINGIESKASINVNFLYRINDLGNGTSNVYLYLYQTQWYSFSTQAIFLMIYVSFKIFLMILAVSILTSTTSSIELTYALEDILNFLRIFKLPVNEWSTTIALSIRFIPSLLDESSKIMNAQSSRGLDFTNGNFKEKIVSLSSLIVPLFSIAFRKADELANAMEARGYNPRYTRTRYREFDIKFFDWLVFSFFALALGLMFVLALFNNRSVFFSPLGLYEAIIMYK